MALQRVKIGQVDKPIFIEKLKGDVNNEQIISIISDDAIPVGIIYVDDFKQSFYIDELQQDPHLFETLMVSCGRPRRLYIMPCVKYNVWQTPDGQKQYGGPLSLFYLGVTEYDYKSKIAPLVEDLAMNNRTISTIDIRVKTIEKGDFTEMTFRPVISGNCVWRSDAMLMADVREKINQFDALIEMSIAARVDAATFAKRWYEKHPLIAETAVNQNQVAPGYNALPMGAQQPQAYAQQQPQMAVAQQPQAYAQPQFAQAQPQLAMQPQAYAQPQQQAYAQQPQVAHQAQVNNAGTNLIPDINDIHTTISEDISVPQEVVSEMLGELK